MFCLFSLLSPLTMDEFGWSQTQVVLYNNLIYCSLSVITIIVLNVVKYVTKRLIMIITILASTNFCP